MEKVNYRPEERLVKELSKFSSATVYEAIGRVGAIHSSIKPLDNSFKLCGPALTVHGKPGDNLALHHSIYSAQPGDILVASVDEYDEAGYWGEILNTAAISKKIGGFVFDGGVRDTDALKQSDFPIFCKNVSIKGTTKSYPGEMNTPLVFMGTLINPGDVVLGDEDGLVVIPSDMLEQAIQLTKKRINNETKILNEIESRSTLEIYNLPR